MKIVTCLRCGHEWPTKLERPVRCAKCRTPYWDRYKTVSELAKELPADHVLVKAADAELQGVACGHTPEPTKPGKCNKWGYPNYAFAR